MEAAQQYFTIRGTYPENKDTFFKTTTFIGAIFPTGISHEERQFIVDSGASVHLMSKSDLTHEEKETVGKSEESCTIITANGSIIATEEAALSVGKLCEEHMVSRRMEGKTIAQFTQMAKTIASRKIGYRWSYLELLSTHVPSGDAEAASGNRTPTGSGSREQDIPDWLQQFTDGLAEGEPGSSVSTGETIPKTLPPRTPARRSNKSGRKHNLFTHFPKDPICDMCKRTKTS